MNQEQEKLLAAILKELVTACYSQMGREWCEEMSDKIDKLISAGKK